MKYYKDERIHHSSRIRAAALAAALCMSLTAGAALTQTAYADGQETCDCSCDCGSCKCGSASEKIGMANPWQETEDLQEACAGAGIRLDEPIPQALPKDTLEKKPYRYMDGTLELIYADEEDELTLRVSTKQQGFDLTGDYNKYSEEWDENYKGLVAHCRGDGEKINAAVFDGQGCHFAVMYDSGQEGRGLTSDQLKSLVMCIQADPMEDTDTAEE